MLEASHQPFPPIPQSTTDFVSNGVNQRPTFFGCDPDSIGDYPLVIYLPNSPPLTGDDPTTKCVFYDYDDLALPTTKSHTYCSTDTFKIAYTLKETRLFLDQTHSNTIGGFMPNSNTPDPNWGKCLQCAAVDRARLRQNVTSRSSICQQCFSQYCYDHLHPPSSSELPNRKFTFVDPDPQGVSQIISFLSAHKGPLVGGLLGLVAAIGALIGFLYVSSHFSHLSKSVYTLLISSFIHRLWRNKRKRVQYKKIPGYQHPVWRGYEEFELPATRGVQ